VTEPKLTMSANRPIVLILTSDPAFSREITANWPQDPIPHSGAPEFIVLGEDFSRDLKGSNYDLAIADASYHKTPKRQVANHQDDQSTQLKALKQSLAIAGKPAIVIHSNPAADFNNSYKLDGAILELRREPGLWRAMAGLIGREILRRRQAELHACEAEQTCVAAQAEATLGRYMVEMRTNINNALTTLLGNAELLALEPGLPSTVQAQADTIRNMALRLHEVFRRFSSIEKELNVAARESGKKAHAAHN
jgi:hypothetical protein